MIGCTPEYDLSISVTGQGIVSPNVSGPYKDGEQVLVSASPVEGWRFDKWQGDYTGTDDTITLTMDSDIAIEALFIRQYTLNLRIVGTGGVKWDSDDNIFDDGSIATLTAEPESGWRFDEWQGDALGGNPSIDITMNSDKHVTAVFVRQ